MLANRKSVTFFEDTPPKTPQKRYIDCDWTGEPPRRKHCAINYSDDYIMNVEMAQTMWMLFSEGTQITQSVAANFFFFGYKTQEGSQSICSTGKRE